MSRDWIGPAAALAAEAIDKAVKDCGIAKPDLDGLLINNGGGGVGAEALSLGLQSAGGYLNLKLCAEIVGFGSSTAQMVQYASLAIQAGMASTVACVYATSPMASGASAGASYAMRRGRAPGRAVDMLDAQYGMNGANTMYALAARRHMHLYGTTKDQFGAVAISNRSWAAHNPEAIYRTPITLEDYHDARLISEPFNLFDCTLVNNGAVCVIVTSPERARSLKRQPVYVLGMGQGHPGNPRRAGFENEVNTGAQIAGKTAFAMAGLAAKDVTVCELYDCYTYTTIVTLEDYGFAKKGEGGPFVATGAIAPGGSLPTNTGGGQLSAYYMWGMTPLSEAVIQARGDGGARQVKNNDCILVSTQGGMLDYHGTVILSPHESAY
jgi:acetyl-CoA acetyltransferase